MNGKLNGNDNGEWIWILMDEQMDFYNGNENGQTMDNIMGNKWEVNLKNDLIITNNNGIQNNFYNEKRV